MRYLHTMLRVRDLDAALDFYCNKLGLTEVRRRVDDIYATCDRLMKGGVTINRPPRDGTMAFVRSPDKHSIELLQKGAGKPPQEPWKSMQNTGKW